MSGLATDVQAALRTVADADGAALMRRFFKSGPGQYGEGDVFIGVRVPVTRRVVRRFGELPLAEIDALLDSEVHEDRFAALLILVARFTRAGRPRTRDDLLRDELSAFYLAAVRRGRVNNWDLVDASAEFMLGETLVDRPRDVLFSLAASPNLWERRVAVLATFAFIKRGDPTTTLELASLLLDDPEDLIHKAVGWMLREIGKRASLAALLDFLDINASRMPRTMLSYATEHLDRAERARYRAIPRG